MKVDGGEPSEKYWLSLMRAWLRSLQTELDQAIAMGQVSCIYSFVSEFFCSDNQKEEQQNQDLFKS